jgi:hypothetical protein
MSIEYEANTFESEKIDSFNSLLSELNDCIQMFKNRTLIMNINIPGRTHDYSVPLDLLWENVSNKGEEIEEFLLDYKKNNTNNEIYKNMVKKINIAYKEFQTFALYSNDI